VKTNLLTRVAHATAVPEPRWGDSTQARAWRVASSVSTPRLPALTLGDLGLLCDVTADDMSRVHVQLLPFAPDDPEQETICAELVDALTMAGYLHVDVELVTLP